MKPGARRRVLAVLGLASALPLAAPRVGAFTMDARRLGMGSTLVPGSAELTGLNVATQCMPERPGLGGRVVPLPLGLVQLATDFPSFDPDDENFSVTRLANLALNPPFFLELTEPAELDGDISIYVARNQFSILFEDAQALLPQKPFEVGGVWSVPLVSLRVDNVRAYAAPVVYLEGELGFDDALYRVLARGESLQPNKEYIVDAHGESMAGTSLNFGWSGPLHTDVRGDGVYAGFYVKYLLGLTMGHGESRLALATGDTLFGGSDPLDVGYEALVRYARPGRVGNGVGFDAGLGCRLGAYDLGVSVRDLATRVHWGNTFAERAFLNETTNEVETEVLVDGQSFTQAFPTQATLHMAWTRNGTLLASDLTTSRLGTSVHWGVEQRTGPLALRSGLLRDTGNRMQFAGGFGVGLGKLWLDLALQTHSRTFTGERGLMLGTSIALR